VPFSLFPFPRGKCSRNTAQLVLAYGMSRCLHVPCPASSMSHVPPPPCPIRASALWDAKKSRPPNFYLLFPSTASQQSSPFHGFAHSSSPARSIVAKARGHPHQVNRQLPHHVYLQHKRYRVNRSQTLK
jgi:hypothetical protein